MRRFLSSAKLCIVFLINTAFAENSPSLSLGSGLWEGVSETNGTNYYLLQLNDSGEHKLFIATFELLSSDFALWSLMFGCLWSDRRGLN